jgi:hypothetical protein
MGFSKHRMSNIREGETNINRITYNRTIVVSDISGTLLPSNKGPDVLCGKTQVFQNYITANTVR